MEMNEIGRGSLGLTLDSALLERQAASLEARLRGVFADMGRDISAQFPARAAPLSRILADWEKQAARLRGEFAALGDVLGSTAVIAAAPATEAVNGFMRSVRAAAETFRSFVFSLFGKKAYEASSDTAAGLDEIGRSAGTAAKRTAGAANQIRRSLMSFDRINRLAEQPGSGCGGSAGGGRAGSLSGSRTAEEWIAGNPFGEYLRTLLDDRRFYEAGAALAAKAGQIIDGLDAALNAESFRARVKSSLTAIVDAVNGYLDGITFTEEDTRSVAGRFGDLIGDALGLALESIHLTLTGVHWENLGRSVAQAVNGALASLREQPVDLGTVLADWLNAGLGSLDGFLAETDWAEVGQRIGRNISSWFDTVDWELAGRSLRDGVTGLRETILSAIAAIDIDWGDILSAFGRGLTEKDHPTLAKLLFGDGESVSLTAEITGVRDAVPQNKRTLSDFVSRFRTWTADFKTDPWSVMRGVFSGSNWTTDSSFAPWSYIRGWFRNWDFAGSWSPWSYIKGWFKDWSLFSGWNPWSYIRGWFKDWDFTGSWNPWSYIKGWFKDWDFSGSWDPWSYIKGWFKNWDFASSWDPWSYIKGCFMPQ